MKYFKKIAVLLVVLIGLFCLVSCDKKIQKNESVRAEDADINEDFNAALGEALAEISEAVDVAINPEHFDYDKGEAVLSLTSENSIFGQFRVGIRYIQLIDTSGYSFALFDANLAKKNMDVDFAQLTQGAKFLVNQPHVPIGTYKSLVIEFDFKDADTKAWIDDELFNTYLLSDDGLTFGVDQVGYRISVDLDTEPVLVLKGGKTYINLHIDLDDSVLRMPVLDNALPKNSALMLFHPSLDISVGEENRRLFFFGKFRSIIDMDIDILPFDLVASEGYDKLLNKDITYKYDENTQFFIDGKRASIENAQIALAQKTTGFARLEGVLSDTEASIFDVDRIIFSEGDNTYRGMIKGGSANAINLIHNKIQLNDFLLNSAIETIDVSAGSTVSNAYAYKEDGGFSDFAKPYQYVTVSSGNASAVLVHLAKLSGYVESVEGLQLRLRLTSINHISTPSIAYPSTINVQVLPASTIKEGDYIVADGYFYQDHFVSFSESKYSPDVASLMVWLDEMPPNNTLNKILVSQDAVSIAEGADKTGDMSVDGSDISDIPLANDVINKSHWRYKKGEFIASLSESDMFDSLSFDDSASFYLQSYSTLNPHIAKYDKFSELHRELQVLMGGGAHIYSVLVKGKVSGNKILAKSGDRDLVKVRLRGRSIDSALARTIFDDDYHGEKKWGGLTLAQVGAIMGSIAGLLILEYVLEKMKLGPKSQLSAPDFCKPGKKSKKGNSSPSMASKAKSKLKSAGSVIGSIGGIASCLKKLASFSTAEPDLKRFSKQINSDALYVDGEKGKNSALLVLHKKKLTKKGADFYSDPEQRKNFEKILNASERINEVFNKMLGGKTELKGGVSEMAMQMKMNISPKLKKDNDIYIKLVELDVGVRDKILAAVESKQITFTDDAGKDKFQNALKETTKTQTRGGNVADILETFNREMGFTEESNKLVIEGGQDREALSSESQLNRKLSGLYSIEKAFMKYQADPTDDTRRTLAAELGDQGDSIVTGDKDDVLRKVSAVVDSYRDEIDMEGDAVLQGKAKVLQALDKFGAVRSNVFFEFQADSLVREKMIDDMKKTIITVETSSDDVISVKNLMAKYQEVKKISISASDEGGSRNSALGNSLDDIIKRKGNVFAVDGSFVDVSKKRKVK